MISVELTLSLLSLIQGGLGYEKTMRVNHVDDMCTGSLADSNIWIHDSSLKIQWNRDQPTVCSVYVIPTSPQYRVCVRILDTDVYLAKILLYYIKDYTTKIFIRVISDNNAPKSIVCAQQGKPFYIRLQQYPIYSGDDTTLSMESMTSRQNSSSSVDQVTTMRSGQSSNHTDPRPDDNASLTIYTEELRKVNVTDYYSKGYARLDYVMDNQPLILVWIVRNVIKFSVYVRPSIGKMVCIVNSHHNLLRPGTFVDLRFQGAGEHERLAKLDFKSNTGKKICTGTDEVMVTKFVNLNFLSLDFNSSITLEVTEITIPAVSAESGVFPMWTMALLFAALWLTALIVFAVCNICKYHQVPDDQVYHTELSPDSSQYTTEVSYVREEPNLKT